MTLIPWGRIAVIVGVLALLGWVAFEIRSSGKDAGLAEGEKARAALAESLAYAQAQTSTCSATLDRITSETDRGLAEADARAAAGERAAAVAEQAAKAARERADKAAVALAAAKRVPACRVQLEMVLCDEVALL